MEGHETSEHLLWIFEQGDLVEAEARRLFPDGQLVAHHSKISEHETRDLIALGSTTIFQATAIADDLFAMADIFRFDSETKTWDIFEVKSTTEVEEKHLHDVCFQMITFRKAGYALGRLHLIHINPEYVRQGEIDPQAFLITEDITEKVHALETEVAEQIKAAKKVIASSDIPSCDGCTCYPKDCPCRQYCYSDLPDYSVFNLYKIWGSKAKKLYLTGIRNLVDVPDDFKLTKAQLCQVQAARTGKAKIELEKIREELGSVAYPVTFLDYETFFPAVPLFDGLKPYQQMVFQYSLHTLSEDGELNHFEYLAPSLKNPVNEILQGLQKCCPRDGTVIVWNKSFEMARNDEMSVLSPSHASFLQSINGRVYDLMDIFRKLYYVHPDFRGSCSIKKVLPVLVPSLSHKDLEIQDGGTASLTWYRMLTDGRSESEKQKSSEDMLAYCKLDTLAMVEVFRFLQTIIVH